MCVVFWMLTVACVVDLNIDVGPTFVETDAQESVSDFDQDGFIVEQGDCDDADASVYPQALTYCDGELSIDRDCDQNPDALSCDHDFDGYTPIDGDCNDSDASAFPSETEFCGDPGAVDNDCDGLDDENDDDCTYD